MKLKTNKGFTLVELLVVTAIFLAMIGAVYASLYTGRDSLLSTKAQIQLQENLRRTVQRVTRELQETGLSSYLGMETY